MINISSVKRKIRTNKRKKSLLNKPIICKIDLGNRGNECKIEIEECGKRILKHKGNTEEGYKQLKIMFEDVLQVVDKEQIEYKEGD